MMRKIILIPFVALLLLNCSSDDSAFNNPNLPDYAFDTGTMINTNLPKYNDLKFPGNYIIEYSPYGINGFVLYYIGGTTYTAFELTDPNHQISSCSKLTVDGIIATCGCKDENSYNIINGNPESGTDVSYALKPYYVTVSGSIIRVYNN